MKKVFFICSLALASIAANAQLYVGGSLGLTTSATKNGSVETTTSSFTLAPEVGYSLSDKFDVGGVLSLTGSDNNGVSSTSAWSFAPYARYAVAELGKFKLLGKALISMGGNKVKAGSTLTTDNTTVAVGVLPMVTYSLTDHVLLTTELSFLRLGFSTTSNGLTDATSASFNFGANSNLFTTGNLLVGFAYIF
ncbi:MAG: hypothetical protein LBR66_01485 [Candidatus Symbiothrix sp.]|jgi:hypothetical protein|nr:hypothetical protein [Candidatus Symbiothrix sp.]